MSNSILSDTKKILGFEPDYDAFDLDIITHINSAFNTLTDLGVGPPEGFMIADDSTEWVAFLGNDLQLNRVKTYVYMRVRMAFDPPGTSFHLNSLQEQIKELEWRLNVHVEPDRLPVEPIL